MKRGAARWSRRLLALVVAGILALALTACTGRGGGQLPPQQPAFAGSASIGFTFSCQDSGGLNPPTGRLSIELAYDDKGTNPLGPAFGIHGVVDTIDPVLESMICIGKNPPPAGSALTFLGRYRPTTRPAGLPKECAARGGLASELCRFEVVVKDNDGNLAPSQGDYFQITLSSATDVTSVLDPATVVYTRAGVLSSGNITVK